MWPHIHSTIEEKLHLETKIKYKNLDKKINQITKTQTTTPLKPHTFHPRVVNNTNINFTNNETALLQKGIKYNTQAKKKGWIQNVALEAETAFTQLPTNQREVYRKLVADSINTLEQKNPKHSIPRSQNHKVNPNQTKRQNALVTRADKGNSIVILPTQQYETKIQILIHNNNYLTATTGPTNTFHNQIRQKIK